jgi:esterase/lipase
MRGHGESEGDIKTFTVRDFLKDVIAAYDYLLTLDGVDKENISAIGSSFGGYLLLLLSEKKKIINLSLRVPADYPNEHFDQSKYEASGDNPEIMNWRKTPKSVNASYALQALHTFSGNVQIIESENDTVVPHQTIENYLNALSDKNKLTYVVLKNAPHSLSEGHFRNQVEKILVDWFKNKI